MGLIEDLNTKFAIKGTAEIAPAKGNLPAITLFGKGDGPLGLVYLHGAHVAAWRPPGFEEVLWLSKDSAWQDGKPIRGGVPICFPWFGSRKDDPKAPAHGFVRLSQWSQWSLDSITKTPDGATVSLSTKSSDTIRASWPHDFLLRHIITFGQKLTMSLELTNTGNAPLTVEEAQHTYLSLADVRQARVKGLQNVKYIDKTDAMKEKTQEGDITISAETDRIYLDTTSPITLEDNARKRKITITKTNSKTTVVWNPWIAKAKAMPDFGDDEWPTMICIETCNVAAFALTLKPGEKQTMTTQIEVAPL
jgi:glucose-6-phosphate 1-epimerase